MDPRLHPVSDTPCNGQKLDAVTKFSSKADVFRRELLYALFMNTLKANRDAEGNRDEDRQFVSGVRAIHIQGRRIFSIAEIYGLLHGLLIRKPLLGHLGRDVIGSSVEDTHNGFDTVCGKPLSQGSDNRNASSYTGFKSQADP